MRHVAHAWLSAWASVARLSALGTTFRRRLHSLILDGGLRWGVACLVWILSPFVRNEGLLRDNLAVWASGRRHPTPKVTSAGFGPTPACQAVHTQEYFRISRGVHLACLRVTSKSCLRLPQKVTEKDREVPVWGSRRPTPKLTEEELEVPVSGFRRPIPKATETELEGPIWGSGYPTPKVMEEDVGSSSFGVRTPNPESDRGRPGSSRTPIGNPFINGAGCFCLIEGWYE